MDTSITTITPGMWFDRGVTAHAQGRGIDDHYMNPGSPAINDFQAGWRFAEQQARAALLARAEASKAAKVLPP